MKSMASFGLGLALLVGCSGSRLKPSPGWSAEGALDLKLELLAVPDHDLQRAQFKLTVSNVGPHDVVLDQDLTVGFSLSFKTDLSEEDVRSDKRDVSAEVVERLAKPAPEAARDRFVVVQPGAALVRIFDLAQPARVEHQGHASDLEMRHHGFYYEAITRFHVPPAARTLQVEVWHEDVWMMATPQFAEWHGASAETLGLWPERARSNSIVIRK